LAALTGLLLLAGPLPAAALLTAATRLLLLLAGLLPAAALLTALTGLLLLLAGLLPAALLTALLAALVLLATLVRIIHLAHRSVGMPPDDKHTWSAKFRPRVRDGAYCSDPRRAEPTRLTCKTRTTTCKRRGHAPKTLRWHVSVGYRTLDKRLRPARFARAAGELVSATLLEQKAERSADKLEQSNHQITPL
jgi:hypothetical protein